ncbi:hypothetical protein [Citromicrobium sp. RCC1897]|uniref:hypothetical protein n=1 Tax=Citromicrobium sp. RCC1897 TaxID=1812182 RepID=UPI000A69F640|nr:hypothetical protein [Citromicrobium sp. RCC1897]
MSDVNKPIVGLIEWVGSHPFATGVMALLGLAGTVLSVYGFEIDRTEAQRSTEQGEEIGRSVNQLASDSYERETDIQERLGRIEESTPQRSVDRVPQLTQLPYPQARQELIDAGWIPSHRDWQHYEEYDSLSMAIWRHGYKELDSCAGTGAGYCKFDWHLADGTSLTVITEGTVDASIDYDNREFTSPPSFQNVRVVRYGLDAYM